MALLTTDDLGKALKVTFTAGSAEKAQAQFFCDQVEAYISDELDMLFTATEVSERQQADYDGIIRLNKYPVSVVTSVSTIDGAVRTGWSFDGIDEIDGLEAHEVVDIVYTAGVSSVPSVLNKLATSVAARMYVNPNGIRQQTVGAISETYAAGSGDSGTVYFTVQERTVLDRYKNSSETWRLGPRNRAWRPSSLLPTL